MKITIWKMTALLAVHLASSLLPAAGAVKGIREGDRPLPPWESPSALVHESCAEGSMGRRGLTLSECPLEDPLHTTLSVYFYLFLVWSTLRLLERIFQEGFLFLNNIMGHFAFFFLLHHIVTSSLECDGFDSIYFQIKPWVMEYSWSWGLGYYGRSQWDCFYFRRM